MESFESRFSRLTPEQQKEVEDFMDFLLLKNTLQQVPAVSPTPPVMLNTPPVMVPDPASAVQRSPGPAPVPATPADSSSFSPISDRDSPPMHEITVGDEDWISRDYMDYGKFEPQPSPATEAVRKVKQKIIARQEKENTNHLLDWVD